MEKNFFPQQWQTSCFSLTNLPLETGLKTNFATEIKILEGSG
jgi:hypothetical protein